MVMMKVMKMTSRRRACRVLNINGANIEEMTMAWLLLELVSLLLLLLLLLLCFTHLQAWASGSQTQPRPQISVTSAAASLLALTEYSIQRHSCFKAGLRTCCAPPACQPCVACSKSFCCRAGSMV